MWVFFGIKTRLLCVSTEAALCIMHFVVWMTTPRLVQKCLEFSHFLGRSSSLGFLFQHSTHMRLNFFEGDPHFLPPLSSLESLMGAAWCCSCVYFIKIHHQHFDDNHLWKNQRRRRSPQVILCINRGLACNSWKSSARGWNSSFHENS